MNSYENFNFTARSPIYSHLNATLQGSATIHVFNANKMLENEFHQFQDQNTSSAYLFICASRWFAFWLDVVCLLFIAFVTYSFLLFGNCKSIPSVHLLSFKKFFFFSYKFIS